MSLPLDITPQHPPFTLDFALSFSRLTCELPLFLETSYARPARDATLISTSPWLAGKERLHTAVILRIIFVKVGSRSLRHVGCIGRRVKYERVVGPCYR